MSQKININQICRIEIFYCLRNRHFLYKKKSKFKFWIKEGFYYDDYFSKQFMTEEEIINKGNLVVMGTNVVYSPHVEIYLSNQDMVIDWFNSSLELDRFVNEYLRELPLIVI